MSFIYQDMSADSAAAGNRDERSARILRARMLDATGAYQDVVIRNLSRQGLGAVCKGIPPLVGDELRIFLSDQVQLTGKVRWVRDSSFGLLLDEELDMARVSHAISRKMAAASHEGQWQVRSLHRIGQTTTDPSRLRRV